MYVCVCMCVCVCGVATFGSRLTTNQRCWLTSTTLEHRKNLPTTSSKTPLEGPGGLGGWGRFTSQSVAPAPANEAITRTDEKVL